MRLILILTALLAFQSAAASQFDETKALAEQGDADAQYNLGIMYDTGLGVPENDAEAVKWFRKAAEQGYAYAQFKLGNMYVNGEGVPVPEFIIPWFSEEGAPNNNTRAYVWWSVAKTQGYADAATNLDILKPQMTPQQIADGQALAAKCYESNYKDCD
jgi:TPR repeat protein